MELPIVTYPYLAPDQIVTESEAVEMDPSKIQPMYKERLAVNMATVVKVALAKNLDIQLAQQRVEAYRGRVESSWGAIFPSISPTASLEGVDGTVRATPGNLTSVAFRTFQPFAFVQWVLNPGKVYYDIVAARKRLLSTQYEERAVVMQTLEAAVRQYYDLALAQAKVSAAFKALTESTELLRIAQSRVKTGAGLAADESRAKAEVASRQQDLILALKSFYDASVALSVTLNLDSTVTLIPSVDRIPKITLVRDDVEINELLALAVEHRDDLKSVRTLIEAVAADKKSTFWGSAGPQFQIGYQGGGISGQAQNVGSPPREQKFGMSDLQRFTASAMWKLGVSTFGEIKTSRAVEKKAYLQANRKFAAVRADVVRAAQDIRAQNEVIERAHQQVIAAEEALRITKVNLVVGTMTILDVLHAENVSAHARLRYSETVVRYNQAQVMILAAVGLLSEKSLYLEPVANIKEIDGDVP
ncbi:MAG: TolC family protein [Planctomycetes bacterium]|nr:TolC family protein [Planctomycetota bacterium]